QTNDQMLFINGNFGVSNQTLGSCSCAFNPSSSDSGRSCACTAIGNQCNANDPVHDPDWGLQYSAGATGIGGGTGPLGSSAWAAWTRDQEIMQGKIGHAMILNFPCSNGNAVFPAENFPGGACGTPNYSGPTPAPPVGALFFCDYTPAQIANMNVTPVQKTLLSALCTYGAYTDVFGGSNGMFLSTEGHESAAAWKYAGLTDPIFDYLNHNAGINCSANYNTCVAYVWANIPLLPGPGTRDSSGRSCSVAPGCDFTGHIHMADSCVARGLAGQPGGCN
ncbi:MAG TPA: hypothetical protein VKT29_12525, partial [Terriglobales bacterium]|nr:hypothetical protein [Terriglobales bacterium]